MKRDDFISDIETRYDAVSRQIYSVDASIYEVAPKGIFLPKTKEELIKAIALANDAKIPITARGAATGITGGCLGEGMIVDTSVYLNQIEHIDLENETATVEPGVIQDQLNAELAKFGYRLGPDTSTGDRATIGGMTANNAAGARSLLYGRMVDAVEEIELILSGGDPIAFKMESDASWKEKLTLEGREGHIYREIEAIKKEYGDEIRKVFPKIPRRVSGYNLDELIKPSFFNIAKIIAGSEGTLGVISKIKVKIVKKPKNTALCVLYFPNISEALAPVETILKFRPIALELIDDKILAAGIKAPSMRGKLNWLKVSDAALLAAEFQADTIEALHSILDNFQSEMQKLNIGTAYSKLFDPQTQSEVWALRKSGLGLLLSKRSYSRAIAFIEDLSVAPEKLASFIERFTAYLKKIGKDAGVYGHAGSGCMHIRPFIDVRSGADLDLAKKIMLDVSEIVQEFGGAMSGEHGDGLIRSWMNEKMFGPKLYEAFKRLKRAFDPLNLMNPGKIVNGRPFRENLRFNPDIPLKSFNTFFSFKKEGGFELAVDLCNGNGFCRKKEGVMCPSFQVTHDEYDSTRARATALQGILKGKLHPDELANKDLLNILDLCIQCKGCKTECPSQVDMAKMKSEVLFQYQEKYGYSFRGRLFGELGKLLKWASPFRSIYNRIKDYAWVKSLLGIAGERKLPRLAKNSFSSWFAKYPQKAGKKVVLFNDTYTEFIQPEIGKAAVKVLNALGYEVIVLPWSCCGRPFISKGFLKEAKSKALKFLDLYKPYQEFPLIGLEPSCILSFVDEYSDLLGDEFFKKSILFDSFLEAHLEDGRLPLHFKREKKSVQVQVHCHQKALIGSKSTLEVLKAVDECKVVEIPSGCCGMAGSFGYEKEHYTFSMKIADLVLLKTIKQNDAVIIANGFSCRTQILDGSGKKAYHLAEFLAKYLLVDE